MGSSTERGELRSRFEGPDAFQPSATYRLLPFHFIRLRGERYVATNLVGEHVLLHYDELTDLVHKRLPAGSPLFAELGAKHFLASDSRQTEEELLAVKYRTKLGHLPQLTSLHMFVVTQKWSGRSEPAAGLG